MVASLFQNKRDSAWHLTHVKFYKQLMWLSRSVEMNEINYKFKRHYFHYFLFKYFEGTDFHIDCFK